MTGSAGRSGVAGALALSAGFIWASYYFFVYAATPAAGPGALIAEPFLFAGVAYCGYAVLQGHGDALRKLLTDGQAYLRVGLLLAMQLSVLAVTYLAGAVDAALLSLVGDVVFTPLFLMLIYREGRAKLSSVVFLAGLLLSTAGASLTIVGSGQSHPLSLAAWLVAPVMPVAIGLYFLLMAKASRSTPVSAVVGHATIVAGIVTVPVAFLLPGGLSGLLLPLYPTLLLVVALGLSSFFLAPALYFSAIERAGLILPALLMASIPVFTLALSAVLLGIVPPPIGLLGIPIAVVGAVLSLRGEHEPWKREYTAPP
ncbi:MAG: DMT family transporter [Thermoplasmata archaeon]|nr:DMT family transporter [Thermoplasmata archaeon]